MSDKIQEITQKIEKLQIKLSKIEEEKNKIQSKLVKLEEEKKSIQRKLILQEKREELEMLLDKESFDILFNKWAWFLGELPSDYQRAICHW